MECYRGVYVASLTDCKNVVSIASLKERYGGVYVARLMSYGGVYTVSFMEWCIAVKIINLMERYVGVLLVSILEWQRYVYIQYYWVVWMSLWNQSYGVLKCRLYSLSYEVV
jgi:hypothetical protein